jgi:beta-ureidopropionase
MPIRPRWKKGVGRLGFPAIRTCQVESGFPAGRRGAIAIGVVGAAVVAVCLAMVVRVQAEESTGESRPGVPPANPSTARAAPAKPTVAGNAVVAAKSARRNAPGRPVKVAAIAIGFGGVYEAKLRLAVEHLEAAGRRGVDIACLPEEFAGTTAEPIPGPTTRQVGRLAKQHRMYVVCPIREQAGNEQFNTAVLIDRRGEVVGKYRKVYVFWGEGLVPGRDGVPTFDTDFGRIAMLTCFDLNFAELWHDAELRGAEIVFWPSAYGGGSPLSAYAMLHQYHVVAVGDGNLIDATGTTLSGPDVERPLAGQTIATFDLDRTFIHTNFNEAKVQKLLKEHAGEVVLEKFFAAEAWYLLRAVKPNVEVRALCKKYGIETLREYRHRSRRQIDEARKSGKPI